MLASHRGIEKGADMSGLHVSRARHKSSWRALARVTCTHFTNGSSTEKCGIPKSSRFSVPEFCTFARYDRPPAEPFANTFCAATRMALLVEDPHPLTKVRSSTLQGRNDWLSKSVYL